MECRAATFQSFCARAHIVVASSDWPYSDKIVVPAAAGSTQTSSPMMETESSEKEALVLESSELEILRKSIRKFANGLYF